MKKVKFYKVKTLPKIGDVGGIYFVSGKSGGIYICTEQTKFEYYSGSYFPIENYWIDTLFIKSDEIITYDSNVQNSYLIL